MPQPAPNDNYDQLFTEVEKLKLSLELEISSEQMLQFSDEIEQLRVIAEELGEHEAACESAYLS